VLTLAGVAADPAVVASRLVLDSGDELVLRPLVPGDRVALTAFFDGLSMRSREFGGVDDDTSALAAEHCDAIGRFDKLRLVVSKPDDHSKPGNEGDRIVGLLELSFDLVSADVERFRTYRIDLGEEDARFGLCVADEVQGTGVAELASRATFTIARAFGRSRLILWGGVREDNVRARRFYRRLGFVEFGTWHEPGGELVRDGLRQL
jgi:GNAT superfamily N-acetyltransferase